MKLKDLVPPTLRLRFQLGKRAWKDRKSAQVFASAQTDNKTYLYTISEEQEIKPSDYYQNKLNNLRLGIHCIKQITIGSGETFSFWRAIGKPSARRGFKEGRNIINGKLTADYGGGLCQLSGIIYLTALRAGLLIVERHNHTVDIYEEEDRFTPLGADATVVYGYKDVRISNPYPFPVRFDFEINNNIFACKLMSLERIEPASLQFVRTTAGNRVHVETIRNGLAIGISSYIKR